ncbi:asparagine synthase [Pontibacillus halophilus JSM 076056 = DSM 19796]|uniref:asparagine synthase (glutamine-hydrolyzing) n=1 Tax=Pontibacillus halophilus JSM 076056 = DSM 19796 TaxID=1385510 RepID=A0A0A5GR81_9BACI|nr:asparagine synthase B [Pontibacillus halophilus]KGX93763.1 asparagine synthase [Pontibacillus halophilus JSM 076056 = DSM 19796]
MCGIFASTNVVNEEIMNEVLNSMGHRGPDEGKSIPLTHFHLGHQRLSIIGLYDGIQPIESNEGNRWIVCNGEIYNYKTLKEQLTTPFVTSSDSEVALKIVEEQGVEGIKQLDGMFAFFIADDEDGTFIAARDTLGIKPLYYGELEDGSLVFASEVKTLYVATEDVHEFPPGHYYTPDTGFIAYNRIEQPTITEQQETKKYEEEIRTKLKKAVQKRLIADVEVGVLLSGGLDSSLIAAIASEMREQGKVLKSFCVGSEGSMDLLRARDVAEAIGTEHYEYVYTEEELIEAIPHVIYHLESYEPSLVRSALPNYFVSKLASEHVKVILSGEGADELFAGYDYLKEFTTTESLNEEILRIIDTLHNINLQRADRMSMAHSLELRVPFLDLELIESALEIPADLKLHKEAQMEKTILRQAFDGYLPNHVLWRKKEEFSAGSGALDILEQHANATVTDQRMVELMEEAPFEIRTKQEALYYDLFKQHFPHHSILETVGKWATG